MTQSFKSLKTVHRLYRRHTLRNLLELLLNASAILITGFVAAMLLTARFGTNPGGVNLIAAFTFVLSAASVGFTIRKWARSGFTLATFFHRWEQNDPGLANRASMLVYAEKKSAEIDRLGYSTELIAADDQWLQQYIEQKLPNYRFLPSAAVISGFGLAVILLVTSFITLKEDWDTHTRAVVNALYERGISETRVTLRVPEQTAVERGKPAALTAQASGPLQNQPAFVHIESRTGWRTITAETDKNGLRFDFQSVMQPMVYYFSVGSELSNRGEITPLDPPVVGEGSVTIAPPQYTGLPARVLQPLQAFSAPQGSRVTIQAKSTNPVREAYVLVNDATQPAAFQSHSLSAELTVNESANFSFAVVDQNGLRGKSQSLALTAVKDATPTAKIDIPRHNANVPGDLIQKVQVHVRDDYRIRMIAASHVLNEKEETRQSIVLWQYSPEAAQQTGSSTDFYVIYDWDLAQLNMFPGDEVRFHIEIWDNDELNGSKMGISDVHTVRFPSLKDLLDEWDEEETGHLEKMEDLVQKQKEITEDVKDTVEKIQEKSGAQPNLGSEEGEESLWSEKQELEQIKQRQQELIEEAKKIEEDLAKYDEGVNENLTEEQKEEQGFNLETLEKIEKIRELFNEMIDQDSQQMMQRIEQTVEQLSQQIDQQLLQDMQFSVEEFEQQLDRTLSMLEQTYENRQLDGLRQMAEELSQRQDHLERRTDQLTAEEQELQEQIAALNQQIQEQMEQNAQQQDGQQQNEGQQNAGEQDQQQEDGQNAEQNTEQNQSGDNQQQNQQGNNQQGDQSQQEQENQQKLDEMNQQKEELEKQLEEMQTQKDLLAQRQEKMQRDTQAMLDRMKEMSESLKESNPAIAQQLQNMQEQAQQQGLMQQMQEAVMNMQQDQMQQAQQNQRNAQQQLQQIAQQMQQQMMDMGMQNMQMDTQAITRLVERGLFLSDNLEPLGVSGNFEVDAQRAIRRAQAYNRETARIQDEWSALSQGNPFMSRDVNTFLSRSRERLGKAIDVSQGLKWVALHESRQSLVALNDALYKMMDDMQEMQQQMMQQQMDANQMQQQMQQMITQQQNLNQMIQQLRQMGDSGEEMLQKLQQMAQRQAQIRREMERMMQQYRHAQQMRNQLQGIYEEMREVEQMLEKGQNDGELEEKQDKILTRMLDAGTFQEKDEYRKERVAENAETGQDAQSPDSPALQPAAERALEAADRPDKEEIPARYREAIKQYYTRLAETLGKEAGSN